MRKCSIVLLVITAMTLSYCSASKKAAAADTVNYTEDIAPIISTKCTPCHIPPAGNKTPYNNYASVKTDIDEILARIQKNPGERGFMPMKHPRLPDSTIQLFQKWKAEGLLEK